MTASPSGQAACSGQERELKNSKGCHEAYNALHCTYGTFFLSPEGMKHC